MASKKPRRLIVGDIHGCADELAELLFRFRFMPGYDALYTVGDVVGKGPKTREALELLRQFGARSVLGNHEHHCLVAAATPVAKRTERHKQYLASLGPDRKAWLDHIAAWPLYIEEPDLIIVHAGLDPAFPRLSEMRREITTTIRTWDGTGKYLNRPDQDPPWFECVDPGKTVIFGHWAVRGLVDLPRFKGLDTGCVYGRELTAWCPEEKKFHHVAARQEYAPMQKD
jgi:diadenosine tetraphosphatase ApaH/serine/threonine PP2A family protein phosphatase